MHRSWTYEFQMENVEKSRKRIPEDFKDDKKKIWVEPIKDWYIFKGDRVGVRRKRGKYK